MGSEGREWTPENAEKSHTTWVPSHSPTTKRGTGTSHPGDVVLVASASRGKKSFTKIWGQMQSFKVRNRYSFINRNDTKEDVFVYPTAIHTHPRNTLARKKMEKQSLTLLKEKRIRRWQMLQALVQSQFKLVNTPQMVSNLCKCFVSPNVLHSASCRILNRT